MSFKSKPRGRFSSSSFQTQLKRSKASSFSRPRHLVLMFQKSVLSWVNCVCMCMCTPVPIYTHTHRFMSYLNVFKIHIGSWGPFYSKATIQTGRTPLLLVRVLSFLPGRTAGSVFCPIKNEVACKALAFLGATSGCATQKRARWQRS